MTTPLPRPSADAARVGRRKTPPEPSWPPQEPKSCARIAGTVRRHARVRPSLAHRPDGRCSPITRAAVDRDRDTWTHDPATHISPARRSGEARIWQAGLPVETPAITLSPVGGAVDDAYRNLLGDGTRRNCSVPYPADGCVLMGGCDKMTPALLMGAISMTCGRSSCRAADAARRLQGGSARQRLRRLEVWASFAQEDRQDDLAADRDQHHALAGALHDDGDRLDDDVVPRLSGITLRRGVDPPPIARTPRMASHTAAARRYGVERPRAADIVTPPPSTTRSPRCWRSADRRMRSCSWSRSRAAPASPHRRALRRSRAEDAAASPTCGRGQYLMEEFYHAAACARCRVHRDCCRSLSAR